MEMTDSLVLQLTDKGLVTDSLTLDVGYDRENCDSGKYKGSVHIDHYGRTVPKVLTAARSWIIRQPRQYPDLCHN